MVHRVLIARKGIRVEVRVGLVDAPRADVVWATLIRRVRAPGWLGVPRVLQGRLTVGVAQLPHSCDRITDFTVMATV
jgi:hypothetical protein